MWSCTWSNKRVKRCYCVRSRLSGRTKEIYGQDSLYVDGGPEARQKGCKRAPGEATKPADVAGLIGIGRYVLAKLTDQITPLHGSQN